MLFHFKTHFPQLDAYWNKYLPLQERLEVPSKTVLLQEGKKASRYIFVQTGCVRIFFTDNTGADKTVQFFFENEGLTSLDSFINNTPSLFTIETIEPSVLWVLQKKHFEKLMEELQQEPDFLQMIMQVFAQRQLHYMNEFVSFIRDTPEQRYLNLLNERPHIVQRVPQHYIASYLGITRVHLSRIKGRLAKKKAT